MSSGYKILLICVAVQCVQANPLFQGLSFQRGFEINFKPWLKEPMVFIKENWSPFGVFGKKIAVQKRSLDDIMSPKPRPAAPVFEDIEEQPIGTAPLNIVPKAPVYASLSKVPPPIVPLPKPMPIIVNDYPPPSPIVPPISTNMVIIPNKATDSDLSSVKGKTLYTDISRVESIEKYIQRYEISPSGSPKPIVVPPASLTPTPLNPEPLPPPPPISTPLPPKPLVVVTPVPPPLVIENPSTVIIPKPPVSVSNAISASVPPPLPPPPPPPSSSPPSLPPPPGLEISPPPIAPEVLAPITPKTPIPIAPEVPTPVLPKEPIPVKEENKEKPPSAPPVSQEVPKTDVLLKNNTFVKGSKMALQFGSVFLTLMAQFFDRARATIDLMTNPPPKFNE